MRTGEDVCEELFGSLELGPLLVNVLDSSCDDASTLGLSAMKDDADVGQADSDLLAGSEYSKSVQVLVGIIAMTRRGAVRHNNSDLVPVSEHMDRHVQRCRCLTDPHTVDGRTFDLRST